MQDDELDKMQIYLTVVPLNAFVSLTLQNTATPINKSLLYSFSSVQTSIPPFFKSTSDLKKQLLKTPKYALCRATGKC